MGTKTGYEIVYCDMNEWAGREVVGTKMGYEIVCMMQSRKVIY